VTHRLARPVIFGLCDGAMSILGIVFYAAGHGSWVLPAAISGGLSAAVSMAGGEWLSESGNGPAAACAMGVATFTGSILPAIPYAFLGGAAAPIASVTACAVVAYVVGLMRRGYRERPVLETFAVLAGVLVVSVACALLIPAGAAG
jgi:VIT1/CCC1 family predicted Fe2+/Mn2+ transporter